MTATAPGVPIGLVLERRSATRVAALGIDGPASRRVEIDDAIVGVAAAVVLPVFVGAQLDRAAVRRDTAIVVIPALVPAGPTPRSLTPWNLTPWNLTPDRLLLPHGMPDRLLLPDRATHNRNLVPAHNRNLVLTTNLPRGIPILTSRSAAPELRARIRILDREVGFVEIDTELRPVEVDIVELMTREIRLRGVDRHEIRVVQPAGPLVVERAAPCLRRLVTARTPGRNHRVGRGTPGVVLLLLDR
ncbi:hypothetical protein FB565_003589 [Actinoplanes lutulentus]|uniref:hypothetical protein n=1 Tax=Actinoplanes lutulentus TaxID=1287878 RepID=UPI0011B94809|nr:hypothetical protein [Actinoplanes lutulentus]MBB2943860.1 hypothetical protein [Actinoplanes lutulentus]